jgi:HD-GYP domain-containing protein (c-di-GMP phosphodiesterase class II)
VGPNVLRWRSLNNLKITKGCKFDCEVLQCFGRLVDKQYIKYNVELMDLS